MIRIEHKADSRGKFSDFSFMYDTEAEGVQNGYEWKGMVICNFFPKPKDFRKEVEKIAPLYSLAIFSYYGDGLTMAVENAKMIKAYKQLFEPIKTYSYCSVNDEFDLVEGMRIAQKKALDKYNMRKINFLAALNSEHAKEGRALFNKIECLFDRFLTNDSTEEFKIFERAGGNSPEEE